VAARMSNRVKSSSGPAAARPRSAPRKPRQAKDSAREPVTAGRSDRREGGFGNVRRTGQPRPADRDRVRPWPTQQRNTEIIYGRQAVREALRANKRQIVRVMLAEGSETTGIVAEITSLAHNRGCTLQVVSRYQFDTLGDVHHQGIAAEVKPMAYLDLHELLSHVLNQAEQPFVLLLDHLQDPQNLGSLLRTAEAAGVQGIIMPERRAVAVTPAVCHASAGASEHLPICLVANLVQTIESLKQEGIWIVGLEAVPQAVRYDQADLNRPLALVIGAEGEGLSHLVQQHCDYLISLPLKGRLSSLNASAAGAIAMYEIQRQRSYQV
jgi:23S rRNA (guanosine2251-2'-O)-methyltransferase